MFNMSKEATQSKFDNLWSNSLTAWAYSTCTQVPESKNTAALFYVQVNHFKINYKIVLKAVTHI